MKYSVGELMSTPAVAFHDDILTAMRTGMQIPRPIAQVVEGRDDYMEMHREPEFKRLVVISVDFVNHYPNTTLTNRQIIETAVIMSYGDLR